MARMRYLKPEFWTDSVVIRLSPFARLMFQGTWNFAMCEAGHLHDDPLQLKMQVLPADDVDPFALLDELVEAGRLVRFVGTDGRKYLRVKRLSEHQKTDTRWSPRCPACKADPDLTLQNSPKLSRVSEDSPKLSEPLPTTHKEGIGGEGIKKPSSTAPRSTVEDIDFVRFWDVYPRKVGKGEARKAWSRLRKQGVDPDLMIDGAKRYRDDPKRKPDYTKHPGPWLNAERWTDQVAAEPDAAPRGWWDN